MRISKTKYYDPKNPCKLNGVDMYRGYYNTAKYINSNIYLNLNPSVKFFQQESVLETIQYCYDDRNEIKRLQC